MCESMAICVKILGPTCSLPTLSKISKSFHLPSSLHPGHHRRRLLSSSMLSSTLVPECIAILDPGLKHAVVDSKHTIAILDLDLEHVAVDCKHAIALLDLGLEHATINLKHATIVPPSLPGGSPLPIMIAREWLGLRCKWLGFDCECL
jgi:hypothetical protein